MAAPTERAATVPAGWLDIPQLARLLGCGTTRALQISRSMPADSVPNVRGPGMPRRIVPASAVREYLHRQAELARQRAALLDSQARSVAAVASEARPLAAAT